MISTSQLFSISTNKISRPSCFVWFKKLLAFVHIRSNFETKTLCPSQTRCSCSVCVHVLSSELLLVQLYTNSWWKHSPVAKINKSSSCDHLRWHRSPQTRADLAPKRFGLVGVESIRSGAQVIGKKRYKDGKKPINFIQKVSWKRLEFEGCWLSRQFHSSCFVNPGGSKPNHP